VKTRMLLLVLAAGVVCPAAGVWETRRAVDPPNDIHFTPGNPFGVRAGVKVLFD